MADELFDQILKEKHIYIYGAGFIGKLLLKRLLSIGVCSDKIEFIVTSDFDETIIMGCKVNSVYDIEFYEGVIIIATEVCHHRNIINTLRDNNCLLKIITIDNELRRKMEFEYMNSKSVPDECDKIDVLIMTSDNYRASGAFLCAAELCEELNMLGLKTYLVLPEYGEGEDLLDEKEIPYFYLPSVHWCCDIGDNESTLPDNQSAIDKLSEVIIEKKVKLIHNNTTYTYVGALAAQKCGLPYIWHLRENIEAQDKKFIDKKYAVSLINESNRVICVSNYIKNCYSFLDDNICSIVYDGISLEHINLPCNKYPKKDVVKIVNVGVQMHLKGQEDIVKAGVFLKEAGIKFNVFFVGDNHIGYKKYLVKMIKDYELNDCFFFVGRTDNVYKYYQEADIAIISSRSEAFGRTTIEAMCSGCLVIGARAAATEELIINDYNGYLYEVGNVKELANVIINTLCDEEKALALIQSGVDSGKEYNSYNNAEKIKKIYEKVLRGE